MNDWNLDERQQNARTYFSQKAKEWRSRAEADGLRKVSTIKQRNEKAIRLVDSEPNRYKSALDLGCGTGELVFEMANRGLTSHGIDYSKDMIELCNEKCTRLGLQDHCRFDVGSVMDFDYGDGQYDLLTAFGFIEYLRPQQLGDFFAMCRRLVRQGGRLQVGSRNRLFNVMSLNSFTQLELGANKAGDLLQEAVWLAQADTLDAYLARISGGNPEADLLEEYPQTDVDVAGYQFAPSVICHLLQESGFEIVSLLPVHYHGFLPLIARAKPEMHARVSNLVHDEFSDEHRLVPQSSTYIITAE